MESENFVQKHRYTAKPSFQESRTPFEIKTKVVGTVYEGLR